MRTKGIGSLSRSVLYGYGHRLRGVHFRHSADELGIAREDRISEDREVQDHRGEVSDGGEGGGKGEGGLVEDGVLAVHLEEVDFSRNGRFGVFFTAAGGQAQECHGRQDGVKR